ncbi:hypothetical protein [Cupriavidus basilensis]|uniref:hypothetical protein n=1 Tax=Cupriavidus basilensis TaxID=68895 RepID=UPI0020A6A0E5|nr:hypothetical protein [Cupriavidus basilensis]MCP3023252.1 hypothetical protein [Cupriavidus basilensis]
MKIYLRPLCLVIETSLLIPARFDGYSLGPLVLVRPGASPGLIAHEKTHVRQFWRWLGTSGLVYQFSRKWRQRFEVEAYRAQLAVAGPAQAQHFAESLATKYDLAITEQEALTLLTK